MKNYQIEFEDIINWAYLNFLAFSIYYTLAGGLFNDNGEAWVF